MFFAINRLCSDELSLLHIMTRYDSDHMNNGHVHDLAGARLSTRETGNEANAHTNLLAYNYKAVVCVRNCLCMFTLLC